MNMPKLSVQGMKEGQQLNLGSTQDRGKSLPNKKGTGRPLCYPLSVDEELVSWILTMRDLHIPVSIERLRVKAKELVSTHNSNFKASYPWVKAFFECHTPTLRAKTSMSQRIPAQAKLSAFFVQEWTK